MGIFRQFPYTNFHELNLDWLIEQIKELSEKWIAYNTTWDSWQTETDANYEALKNYVDNYFKELNVDEEINKLFNTLISEGYFDTVVERLLYKKENPNVNLVGSGFLSSANATDNCLVNGSCYIGNNKYVLYFSNTANDVGSLKTFDANTHTIIYEQDIQLMHGNTLTYDPDNKLIYACGCFSRADSSTLVPNIYKVDASDPQNYTIIETITPPLPEYSTGLYSLAFNITDRKFYAIAARGTTSGEYNRVIVYNENLTEIIDQFLITDTQPVSSQGIQYAYNNILFLMYYAPNYKCIYAVDITTHKISNIYSVPQFINGYRNCGELESIIHNTDSDQWFITSIYRSTGWYHHIGYSISEIGFYKSLPYITITNGNINNDAKDNFSLTVEMGNYVPRSLSRMPSLMDAVMASINSQCRTTIYKSASSPEFGSCSIMGFTGLIVGTSSNHITWKGQPKFINCNIRFTYLDFEGEITSPPSFSGVICNAVFYNSVVETIACSCTRLLCMLETIYMSGILPVNMNGGIITGISSAVSGSSLSRTVLLPYSS